ncbi:MAG: hypothetical protein HY910_07100 [Desulfarculus sp.]|nr:hypothetical protein [Desulfarculus sp.]
MAPELSPQVVQALLRRERLALVGRLLKGVVHNLSGGLQMLRLPMDLLELKLAQGQTQDLSSKLKAMHQGFERTGGEVDLLAAKAGQFQADEPQPLDLCQLAREQLAFWRADMYFKHETKLEADLPASCPKVVAAYQDVALAFNALVANALEVLAPAGARQLQVCWRQEDGRSLLLVGDNGPGPRPEMAAAMFEPFTGDKGGEHDGLGLFLARAALAPWGGGLRWQAGPPLTVFVLDLPLSQT